MRPDVPTYGVTNETEDGYFLPFMDYDGVSYDKVLKDVRHMSRVSGCCTFVILVNSEEKIINKWGDEDVVGNYNVVCLDKLGCHGCEGAIWHTRCDFSFKAHAEGYPKRNHVLRMGAKFRKGKVYKAEPKLKAVVYMPRGKGRCPHEHSKAHADLVKELFGAALPKGLRFDRHEEVEFVQYSTRVKEGDRK